MKFIGLLFLLMSCSSSSAPPTDPVVARGKSLYMVHCTACHASDPARDGPLGPSVAGSSRALLEERILRAAYPEGYTPKRTTKIMVPIPLTPEDIGAIEAYLKRSP